MPAISEFLDRWERRAEEYRRLGILGDAAKIVSELLGDLREANASADDELATLRQAAARSGYSADHIGRLIREGRLPNRGRRGSPRVRVGDLPARREFARTRNRSYDVNADARTLRNGRQ